MSEALKVKRSSPENPLRLLLICSDDPQHTYLRYCLDRKFPGYRCIIEPNAGQIRHLEKKGRHGDVKWMKYHSWRRKLTGDRRKRNEYFASLVPPGYKLPPPDLEVDSANCAEVWSALEDWKPEITVCTGTKYIGGSVIARAGLMLNLHTGYLPDYKGNHCIFFALYDGKPDKVAGTLHQLTAQLDGGQILDLVQPRLAENGKRLSEETLYAGCIHALIDRCVERIHAFARGDELVFQPQKGEGRMFRHRDRTPWRELKLWLRG
ncbi:MAG: hypothetical protein H6581_23925 [Bacteroidia bacterium]|nr:hypothetical protein [Bacteroidia bacterium]